MSPDDRIRLRHMADAIKLAARPPRCLREAEPRFQAFPGAASSACATVSSTPTSRLTWTAREARVRHVGGNSSWISIRRGFATPSMVRHALVPTLEYNLCMAQQVSAHAEISRGATLDALTAAKLRLQPLFPDMDPGDLDLILTSLLRPFGSGRRFFLREVRPGVRVF